MGYSPLEWYRRLLTALDKKAQTLDISSAEYLELLGPAEVDELLLARDRLSEMVLSADEQTEVTRLDGLLVKHHRVVGEWIPEGVQEPRTHWWWFLNEGPQVREKAREAA